MYFLFYRSFLSQTLSKTFAQHWTISDFIHQKLTMQKAHKELIACAILFTPVLIAHYCTPRQVFSWLSDILGLTAVHSIGVRATPGNWSLGFTDSVAWYIHSEPLQNNNTGSNLFLSAATCFGLVSNTFCIVKLLGFAV